MPATGGSVEHRGRRSVAGVRHGIVILPQENWPAAARRWRKAEEYGFDHAWSYDHLSWRSLADQPWHATIPTLTAAATVTDRIGLGLFVASPNFRHPVPFAKELATLDDIAGGRVLRRGGVGGNRLRCLRSRSAGAHPAGAARAIRGVRRCAGCSAAIRAAGLGRDLVLRRLVRRAQRADGRHAVPPTPDAASHRGQRARRPSDTPHDMGMDG